jgi:putative ABC transport system permease protein
LIAGIYPSLYLSSFKPIEVLKGKLSLGTKSSGMRNALVVFQFTISTMLVVSTIIVDRQMRYILTKKTGFDKDHVLVLESTHTLKNKIGDFKNELLQIPGVAYVSISGYLPVEGTTRNGSDLWTVEEPDRRAQSQIWSVDRDYIRTMGMKISEGRDFSSGIASDSQAFVINQAMVKALNLKAPIGRQIVYRQNIYTVTGVMEDYHFESLRQPITPIALRLGKSTNATSLHVSTADMPGLIKAVTTTWKKFSPHQAIRFSFLDQR